MPLQLKGLSNKVKNNITATVIAAFLPSTYGTVAGWYDFSDNTKVLNSSAAQAADGDGIDQGSDGSGNSRHARQTTSANRPTYKTNIVNGLSVARFDGTTDFLQLPSSKGVTSGVAGFTVAVIYKLTNTSSSHCLFEFQGGTAGRRMYLNVLSGGQFEQTFQRVDGVNGNSRYGGAHSTSTWYIAFNTIDATNNLSSVYQNGTASLASGAIDTAGGVLVTSSLEDPTIGSAGLYGSSLFAGDIAEVVFWTGALDTTNRNAAKTALAAKYGITVV